MTNLLVGTFGCAANRAPKQSVAPASATPAIDLLGDVHKRGKLLISTDANYRPLSYRTRDGSWHGFDIDVGREVARRLGVRAEFFDTKFDVVTGGSWNGRWDLNVDSMAITHDRQRALYFTEPYYYIASAFVVHKDSKLTSIEALQGLRIGVGAATTEQAYLEGHLTLTGGKILIPAPPARAIPYDTDQLALGDLALGEGIRLEAALTSLPFARFQISAGLPLRVLGQPVFYQDAAIAIDKHSPLDPKTFYRAVEDTVRAMHRDGTLTKLAIADFGADLSRKQ